GGENDRLGVPAEDGHGRDLLSDREAVDARAERRDRAAHLHAGHHRRLRSPRVGPRPDEEVREVQADGRRANEDLARPWRELRPRAQSEALRAAVPVHEPGPGRAAHRAAIIALRAILTANRVISSILVTTVGLFGFGRIGRNLFRILYKRDDIRVGAIADLADPEGIEYILRFDTILGRFPDEAAIREGFLYVA